MKIISNFSDYYDSGLAFESGDNQVIYLRDEKVFKVSRREKYPPLVKSTLDIFYLQKFNVQVVPAAMNEFALHRILKWCSLNYIRVTLLGFKETGRGTRFKEIAVNRSYNKFDEQYFIEVIKTLNKTHECPRLAIDTTLAGRYKHLLDEEEIPGYLYHIEEGRYSAYIDAVAKKFGPSSYHPDKLIDYEVKYGGDIIEKLFAQIEPTC